MKNTRTVTNWLKSENYNYDVEIVEVGKIDIHTSINWGLGMSEEQYIEKEKEIENVAKENNGYKIRAWCDSSGFDYWVIQQEEDNYITITVQLLKELNDEEIEQLDIDIYNLIDKLS